MKPSEVFAHAMGVCIGSLIGMGLGLGPYVALGVFCYYLAERGEKPGLLVGFSLIVLTAWGCGILIERVRAGRAAQRKQQQDAPGNRNAAA